ncbi:MAG: hypothetical protein AAF664_23955, partial [Planctomycetota bacterium]
NNQVNQIWQIAQPIRSRLHAGLLGGDSLFAKTYRGLLTEEQLMELSELEDQKNKRKVETSVKLHIAQIGRAIPLMGDQRDELFKLFFQQVAGVEDAKGRDLFWLCQYRCSQVSPEDLEKILDPVQLNAMKQRLEAGKRMRNMLIDRGILDGDEE